MVLEKCNLWPIKDPNLEYTKPKCFNCQVAVDFKVCEKRKYYNLYKAPQLYNTPNCSKSWKYNIYAYREEYCQCISKKYYATYAIKKGKCADYKELTPKCISDSKVKL